MKIDIKEWAKKAQKQIDKETPESLNEWLNNYEEKMIELENLQKNIDDMWEKETSESLKEWIEKNRPNYNAEDIKKSLSNKVPIRRGCSNPVCYCTGDCQVIIGYRDKIPGEK